MASGLENIYGGFLETARLHAQREAVRTGAAATTFAELQQAAVGVATKLGDRRGEHIGLLAGNSPAYIGGLFGLLGAGAAAVPFNTMLTPAELGPQMRHADLAALLVSRKLEPLATAAARAAGWDCPLHVLEDMPPAPATAAAGLPGAQAAADDLAMIIYTSGTTGDPKGVMLTQRNLTANFESFVEAFPFYPDDTVVAVLPLFHSFAFTTQLLPCALIGCRLALCSSFKPKEVLQLLQNERRVVFMAVPPMYAVLANQSAVAGEPSSGAACRAAISRNVRLAVSGGGPLPLEVQQAFEERFGVDLHEGYGLTEAAPVVSCNLPGQPNKHGTIGPPVPGVRVQVWDQDDQALATGEEGELVVRGENVMRGYYKNPEATAAALTRGWLRTGDLAVIDADGYIKIVGRKKELIVSAGENIHPREVEEALVRHPAVFEAAVIGIPDRRRTEAPKAFLAPPPGASPDTIDVKAVREFLRGSLATHKIPAAWEVLETLPKNATGKVDKKALSRGC